MSAVNKLPDTKQGRKRNMKLFSLGLMVVSLMRAYYTFIGTRFFLLTLLPKNTNKVTATSYGINSQKNRSPTCCRQTDYRYELQQFTWTRLTRAVCIDLFPYQLAVNYLVLHFIIRAAEGFDVSIICSGVYHVLILSRLDDSFPTFPLRNHT